MLKTARLVAGLLGVCLSGLATGSAWALNYDEGVDGDLSGSTLSIITSGTSTVSGRTSVSSSGLSTSVDLDVFSIDLPFGGAVSNISISITGLYLEKFRSAFASIEMGGGSVALFSATDRTAPIDGPSTTGPFSAFPIQLGVSGLGLISGSSSDGQAYWDYTYTITTEVAAVPGPATLPLLLSVMGGLGLLAQRRRRGQG